MTRVTQAHIDARMADILEAALRVFIQKGTDAATMQEIASEAGLSAGALYRYFANKDELIRAVFEKVILENRQGLAEAAAEARSPFDALRIAGINALNRVRETQGCLDLDLSITAARNGGQMAEIYRRVHADVIASLEAMVRSAQEAGEIGRQLDPALLAHILLGVVNGLRLELINAESTVDPEQAIDLVGTMLFATAHAEKRATSEPTPGREPQP